ncbi:uncharacterized protein LOC132549629 [Ylistrum balloti]|uniref:uncharacterized protein LOC132549629 n=1 Tax=Ylistrum balloti TaxID=509963 RepID=UPI002905EF56|nr:uncharacterized protein LOC132549629 [Ylistrum balloti]
MVWQSSESDLDLEFYYDQIRRDVDAGRVLITLGGTHYSVDNLYYQGSFYQICPRPCHQNLTRSLCNSLPSCSWSHQLGQCTANALLPEKHEVTVLVPCDVLPHQSVQEKDVLIASFRQRVESALHMYPNISTRNVHSFGVGHVYPSSLVFTVQRSMQSPPLSRMVKDLEAWIANGELKINMGPNGTHITARGLGNFTELEVSLLYELIDFTDTSNLPLRQSSAKNITRLVSDVLPLDAISVLNFRFSRNYVILNAVKSATGTMSLKDIENVIRDLWKLGGFGVVNGNLKHIPKQILFQEKFYSNCTIDCSTRTDPDHCNKLKECVWSTERNVSFCKTDQMLPDRYQIDLFAPCMDLNMLSVAEVNDMERLLLGNFTAILGSPKSNVIRNVTITQKGVRVSLQASVQMPYLDTYIAILSNYTDYRTGYRFGVTSRKPLSFRDPFDYTNVLIKLTFNSIDFEILKIKYTYDDLTAKVVQSLNNVLLGVLVQSLEIVSIYREVVEFTLRKDGNSKVNMDKEIRLLSNTIEKGGLVLNIPFVRPVVASNMFVTGSFKELCPDKYPVITTTTVNVPITVSAANITPSQPITMTLPLLRPSVILIYNDSEIDRSRLKNHMDSYGLSTCLVEVHRCPACLTAFSRNTCRFDYSNVVISTTPSPVVTTQDQPHVVPVVEDDYRIGPVAATTMAVGGIFVLALLMWAVQSLHKAMKEKENKSESKPDSQTGRGIEELPVDY